MGDFNTPQNQQDVMRRLREIDFRSAMVEFADGDATRFDVITFSAWVVKIADEIGADWTPKTKEPEIGDRVEDLVANLDQTRAARTAVASDPDDI